MRIGRHIESTRNRVLEAAGFHGDDQFYATVRRSMTVAVRWLPSLHDCRGFIALPRRHCPPFFHSSYAAIWRSRTPRSTRSPIKLRHYPRLAA